MLDSTDVYLAIDQGTHSSRSILFDCSGSQIDAFSQSISIDRIDAVTVQQDADEILNSVNSTVAEAIAIASKNDWQIRAAGLATQRSSVLAWHRNTGQSLSPMISWQDRRAHKDVELLREVAPQIRQRTGLPLTPHYGASKLRWLYDEYLPAQPHVPKNVAVGPLSSYLIANLVSGCHYCVDHTNALRTQLMNLQTRNWDPWLIESFGLTDVPLPECKPVVHNFGNLAATGIPLQSVSGDQTAAMFSQGHFPKGTALVNLGTGGFILKPCKSGAETDPDLLGGLSISDANTAEYLTEGTVNGCGSAVAWAANRLGMSDDYADHTDVWLSQVTHPPLFINSVGGVGSPWWTGGWEPRWCNQNGEPVSQPDSSTAMVAVLESIVFLIYENFRRIIRHEPIRDIRVGGGLSKLDGICHRLANLTNCRVTRASNIESTAAGVAWMAAGRPGQWGEPNDDTVFVPAKDQPLTKRYDAFSTLLQRLSHVSG